jgi:hypothetical protein
VTEGAITPFSRQPQFDRLIIIHVCCCRPVAYLTRDAAVVPLALDRNHIVVTIRTRDLTGILDWNRGVLFNRRCTVMAILAASIWNQDGSGRHERGDE